MSSIRISQIKFGHSDSYGEWTDNNPSRIARRTEIRLKVKNLSKNEIKYLTLAFLPINAVGDICGKAAIGTWTGPFLPGKTYERWNDEAWFRINGIKSIRLIYVQIEFMTGQIEEYKDEQALALIKAENNCYIATAVYGSYDNQNVRVLRRYRDIVLKRKFMGRIFIKVYYFLSPKFINIIKKNSLLNKFIKKRLDNKVIKLKEKGFSDHIYTDI